MIIVEDGTGNPLANAYATVLEADAYLADLEVVARLLLCYYQKAAGLIEATAYLDRLTWLARSSTGARLWAGHHSTVATTRGGTSRGHGPIQVKRATALLAVSAISGALQP